MNEIKLETYKNPHSPLNYLYRAVWIVVWRIFPYLVPQRMGLGLKWRAFLARLFGAKVGYRAGVQWGSKIRDPRNLEIGDHSCLAGGVNCYNVAKVIIGKQSIVTRGTYLCTASHDFRRSDFPLISKPITIGDNVWIAADVFVCPGVTIGDGAVVGARSVVTKDVPPWTVVVGNPARVVGQRVIKE